MKRNCIAGMSFVSVEALQQHIQRWLVIADARVHSTTRLVLMAWFTDEEAAALQPLPVRPLPTQIKRLRRRVADDCLVNVGDVRYSVLAAHVGAWVEVEVTADSITVFANAGRIASHRRGYDRHRCVNDGAHFASLYQTHSSAPAPPKSEQSAVSRPLDAYEAVVQGGAS